MNNVNKILDAANGYKERLAVRNYKHNDIVLTLEFEIRIGRSKSSASRTTVVNLNQFDVDCIADDINAGRPYARVLSVSRNRELLVIVRFPTGSKNHRSMPTAWLDTADGTLWINGSEVVHNRHARVVGWADELEQHGQRHNSGWTGAR